MKLKQFNTIVASTITLSSIILTVKPGVSQLPPGQKGFYCDTSTETPTTIYQNSQGGREPWIYWVSDAFENYSPLTRCKQVSERLETYRRNKQLKFITAGIMNGERVICTASQVNGRCENLIFTLKRGQDAVETLNNFLAWREGQAATPSMRESQEIPYIDVSERIEETAPALTPTIPNNNLPVVPPQPTNDSREL